MKKVVQNIVVIGALVLTLMIPSQASAATLTVPQNYSSIQSAINAAAVGDTILVDPGTYTGGLTLNKAVTLKASSYDIVNPRNNTTVISGGSSAVITIPAGITGNPQVVGFKLQNSSSGIVSNSIYTVESTWFYGTEDQAEYEAGSGGVNRGNVYTNAGDDCIDLDEMTQNLLIENNHCINPPDDAIEMRFQDAPNPSTKLTITVKNNRLEGAGGDGFQFIDYDQDTNRIVILERNLFLNNKKAGVGFLCCTKTSNDLSANPMREEARITNNTFVGNANGITGGGNALVLNNLFLNTSGIALKNVTGSSYVSHNMFYNNGTNSSGTSNNQPVYGNPFTDANYAPQVGSSAIDAGLASYVWNSLFGTVNFSITNFNGNGPDIGWKETSLTGTVSTPGPSPTPQPTNTPAPPAPTIDGIQIIRIIPAVTDDAEENNSTGGVNTSSTDLEFTNDGSVTQTVGMRFDSVSIPKNARIKKAFIEFTAKEANAEATNLTFFAQASDNPSTFSTITKDITNRQKTNSSVAWNNIPAWTIDTKFQTPDLAPVVQEVINRSGWVSGNALAFLVTGTGHRTAKSFDGDNANAPKLVIIYESSTGSPEPTCPTILPDETSVSSLITIPTDSTYAVWSRINAPDTSNNSYYLQIDNQCAITVGDSDSIVSNSWVWVNHKDGDSTKAITVHLTAGTHNVKFISRENEINIDRVIFSTDLACVPTDTGNNCANTVTTAPSNTPAAPTSTPTVMPPIPSPTTVSLGPIEDSHVRKDSPAKNYGKQTKLEVDGNPAKISYLKYDTSTLKGRTVISAKLIIRVVDRSSSTQNIKSASSSWNELTITYNNKPALSSTILTTISGAQASSYKEIDLTNYVKSQIGNTFTIAIDSAGSDGLDFYSDENTISSSYKPRLNIKLQ